MSEIRKARPEDAEDLVRWVDWAGEGVPGIVWAWMAAEGQTARDVGLQRARRESEGFSFRNSWVLEVDGAGVAGLVGFPLPGEPVEIGPDFPAPFVPLQELENLAPGHWYVNVLAVEPDWRSQGVGRRLLRHAEEEARRCGCRGMAIIAYAHNRVAMHLYRALGYAERARRPFALDGWRQGSSEAVLLVKPL